MKAVLMTLVIAIAAGSAGCASVGPHDYTRGEARSVQTVAYGVIESVRAAKITEDQPIVGTLAGAALGGLLGNSIGHGGGRAAATVIGAVGGGIAGNAIERSVTAQNGEELVIRLDSGSTIAVVQGGSQGFAVGQRVRVLTGAKGARVEPAS
jgi:outer membrane lipoprotein SlyB